MAPTIRAVLGLTCVLCLTGCMRKAGLQTHAVRQSDSDLGVAVGSPGTEHFLSRQQLESLPQVSLRMNENEDLPRGTTAEIRGPLLEDVLKAMRIGEKDNDLVELRCTDGYRGNLTHQFLQQHHPVLALSIDGQLPQEWASVRHAYNPGPYFLAYDHFQPTFKIFAHADYAQVPSNIISMHVVPADVAFAPMTPKSATPSIEAGFTIAKQNCLRCHSLGTTGGTKSRYSWADLSQIARDVPHIFEGYIHNPKSLNPEARMPANPGYDQATIQALTAYFSSFPPTDLEVHAR